MGIFRRKQEKREEVVGESLLTAILATDTMTRVQALNIPTVASCTELISNTIASLQIKLYKEEDGEVKEIKDDIRVKLLNDDTKDKLDGYQFKKAMIEDMLLGGSSYAYINKKRNRVVSIHYVERDYIAINKGTDPIFKSYTILCNGKEYRDFEFLKLTRKTKDGAIGQGIVSENNQMLSVAYNSLIYENVLVKTGGNKKGFLKAGKRLTKEVMDTLKDAFNKLYGNNTENVVVLNDGLDFKEASNTSVEMQLNENKKTNAIEICKLFTTPPGLLDGTASAEDHVNFIKNPIIPMLTAFETALNKDLLLEKEKGSFYFAFDTKQLLKGDMYKRYQAYEIAIKNGFMQLDDVRYEEDLKPYGLEFIKLGLQDVLYNPKTKEIYTPNTNKTSKIDDLKVIDDSGGGEEDEN